MMEENEMSQKVIEKLPADKADVRRVKKSAAICDISGRKKCCPQTTQMNVE